MISLLLFFSSLSMAVTNVQMLQTAYEGCAHWSGEEPYSPERQKEITDGLNRDCGKALEMANSTLSKKVTDPDVAGWLLRIVDVSRIGTLKTKDAEKKAKKLCDLALIHFNNLAGDPDAKSTYSSLCPAQSKVIYK